MDQKILPLIAVRDVVIFPGSVIPISIKRESSVSALEEALTTDKRVFLSMQKSKEQDSLTQKTFTLLAQLLMLSRFNAYPME